MTKEVPNINNALKTLPVYHKVRGLRSYYVINVHKCLSVDMKHSVGVLLLNEFFTCIRHLAVISMSRKTDEKIAEATLFLHDFEVITDKVDFLFETRQIPLKKASVMFSMIVEIERQVGALRKALTSQNPQSKE